MSDQPQPPAVGREPLTLEQTRIGLRSLERYFQGFGSLNLYPAYLEVISESALAHLATLQSITQERDELLVRLKQEAAETRDSILMATRAERARCIEALERAERAVQTGKVMPLDGRECIQILQATADLPAVPKVSHE